MQARFAATPARRSTLGSQLLRDTRVGLPFATGGSLTNVSGELNGGFLGGTGNYQKVDLEGRWYAPLGTLGGGGHSSAAGSSSCSASRPSRDSSSGTRAPSSPSCTRSAGCSTAFRSGATTSARSRPTASTRPPAAARPARSVRQVVRSVHRRGGRAGQPVAVREHVLRRGQRVSNARASGIRRGCSAARDSAWRWCRRSGPIGVDLGYGFDRVDATGRPAAGLAAALQARQFLLAVSAPLIGSNA